MSDHRIEAQWEAQDELAEQMYTPWCANVMKTIDEVFIENMDPEGHEDICLLMTEHAEDVAIELVKQFESGSTPAMAARHIIGYFQIVYGLGVAYQHLF
jgi:hypothetical protein